MILSYSEIADYDGKGKTVVLAHGTYDILHKSHIEWLNLAKSQGDILVVAVSPDSVVQRSKGVNRPISHINERLAVLDNIKAVDYVVATLDKHEIQAMNIIDLASKLKPDILFTSYSNFVADYAEVIANIGTELRVRPAIEGGISTSLIINRINERYNENTA